jgi:molybdenum cofactor cytidylyltransferase
MKKPKEGSASRVTLILLAAGSSTRLGGENKLLHPFGNLSVVEHSVAAAMGAGLGEVIVVTGAEAERLRSVLADYAVRFVHNPDYEEGMGTSLREGVRAAAAGGIGICLADMPFIRTGTIAELGNKLAKHSNSIVVPVSMGRRGHPVFFSERFRPALLELSGDEGARRVLGRYPDDVIEVKTEDRGVLQDLDTPEDIDLLRGRIS